MSARPADAPPAVRVGVTGHRPARLSAADPSGLRAEIRRALAIVAGAVLKASRAKPSGSPVLRVVTPLAEGADRLVAEEALALAASDGRFAVELLCPLPFPQAVYEEDFAPASCREFRSLLAGRKVIELGGSRLAPGAAYEAVGLRVIDECDLLLALWDGEAARGRGGSGQIVAEAVRRGLPTVWVHVPPLKGHASCLLDWGSSGPQCGEAPETLARRLEAFFKNPLNRTAG